MNFLTASAEWALSSRAPRGASKGTAAWMGWRQAFLRCRDSKQPGAFRIGRSYWPDTKPFKFDLAVADGLSIGLIGDSGEGKGRSILVPNAATYDGPLLSVDVMGEQALTTALIRAKDHEVLVLDPMGVCAAWRGGEPLGLEGSMNPLDMLHRDDPNVVDEIRAMCAELIQDDDKDQYWPPIIRRFIAGVYGFIVALPEEKRGNNATLASVLDILDMPKEEREKWIERCLVQFPWENDLGRMIRDGGRAYLEGKSEKGKGIMADIIADGRNLGIFGSDTMRRTLQSGPIRFRDLKRRKVSIYLVLPTDKIDSHGAWLRLMVDAAIRDLGQERAAPKVPALLMLDEFANLGRMERVKKAVTYARGDGYRILWTIQDINQLKELYGDAWRTMFSQTGILILLGVQDQETLIEISDAIGDTERHPRLWWIKFFSNLFWKDAHFRLESETVPLFRPEEIREFCSLHGGKALARIRGCRWLRYKRVNYDRSLKAGVDYMVHPKFAGGTMQSLGKVAIAKNEKKLLEAA